MVIKTNRTVLANEPNVNNNLSNALGMNKVNNYLDYLSYIFSSLHTQRIALLLIDKLLKQKGDKQRHKKQLGR